MNVIVQFFKQWKNINVKKVSLTLKSNNIGNHEISKISQKLGPFCTF